jgi:hypothetical protein
MDLKQHVTRIHKPYLKIDLTHLHHVIADVTQVMRTVLKRNVAQIALYMTIRVIRARQAFSIQNYKAHNVHHVDLVIFQ